MKFTNKIYPAFLFPFSIQISLSLLANKAKPGRPNLQKEPRDLTAPFCKLSNSIVLKKSLYFSIGNATSVDPD